MANTHTGNVQPAVSLEEHARIGGLDGKKVFIMDNVGNQITSFAGNATVNINNTINANVSLNASDKYIGLTTNTPVGLHTLAPSPNYIGLASVNIGGNLPAGANYVGLASVNIGGSLPALSIGAAYIGLTTIDIGTQNTIKLNSNVTLNNSVNSIGFATVNVANAINANVSLSDSKGFIGLVTAITRNAGTLKTLIPKNLSFATSSIATIVVPTNSFYITKLILNSNATVRLNIKSGATYFTGNASLGININPGGGWVENGAVDAPVYIGLAAQAAIVIEKFDLSGVVSQIGGHLMYFDE